jgi:hypothetical protein
MISRPWLYFGGFVLTCLLLVGASLVGIVEGLSALTGGLAAGNQFALVAMLDAVLEWILVALFLGTVAGALFVATVVSVLRRLSLPRNERLATIAETLERWFPAFRRLDAADKLRPTTEERQQQLKAQYVAGELSEVEFEREMEHVIDEETAGRPRYGTQRAMELDDAPR